MSAARDFHGDRRLRVVIAGGGIGAVEAVLALRALAGDRVDIELVAPGKDFVFRPLAVAEPFGYAAPLRIPLAELAGSHDVRVREESLAAVDAARASLPAPRRVGDRLRRARRGRSAAVARRGCPAR